MAFDARSVRSSEGDTRFLKALRTAMSEHPEAGIMFTVLGIQRDPLMVTGSSTGQEACGIYHLMAAADDLLERAAAKLTERIHGAEGERREVGLIEIERINKARAALNFLEPENKAN